MKIFSAFDESRKETRKTRSFPFFKHTYTYTVPLSDIDITNCFKKNTFLNGQVTICFGFKYVEDGKELSYLVLLFPLKDTKKRWDRDLSEGKLRTFHATLMREAIEIQQKTMKG
jgi:hypothetical protein